jgi:hopanoid biosynthesis associated protein HpnK
MEPRKKAPTQRRLIVNADDFGISEEVNLAIVRAHKEGILTSTSLMVTGAAFDHAVRLARENPQLDVGIHLVAVMGRSALPPSEVSSLVDSEGNFPTNPVKAGLRYFFYPRARRELRRELAAQFRKFESTGLPLSHVDGHLHFHVHPVIFREALELAAKYGARRMRVPVEERALALRFDSTNRAFKTVMSILFGGLARYMKPKLYSKGFVFPERVYGNLLSGRITERYFLYVLDNLGAERNEIYCHPAFYGERRDLSKDQEQSQVEFKALISPSVAEKIRTRGINLTNYLELDPAR